ncbi:MAG: hypothetical protein JNK05_20185 [Myxococcales bacterium]|nr:hypothetical protein [Myxococcales bacterium]
MADAVAPRATTGDPAVVTEALVRIGSALDRGTIVGSSLLRWPEEPLRSAILGELARRAIAEQTVGRPAACAVVLNDIVECVEEASLVRRRMLRGEKQAAALNDDGNRWAITVDTLWESMAVRAVAVRAEEAWGSTSALRQREQAMTTRLLELDRGITGAIAQWRTITAFDVPKLGDADVRRLERDLAFDPVPAAPIAHPTMARQSSAASFDPSIAQARVRSRKRSVEAWARRSVEFEGPPRELVAARSGPVFVCVERPPGAQSEPDQVVASLAWIGCAIGVLRGRRVLLVTCDEAPSSIEIRAETPVRAITHAISKTPRSSAIGAVEWATRECERLAGPCDVLMVTPKLWISSDSAVEELRPLHERIAARRARLRLLRPSKGALLPIGYDFDAVYSIPIDGVLPPSA